MIRRAGLVDCWEESWVAWGREGKSNRRRIHVISNGVVVHKGRRRRSMIRVNRAATAGWETFWEGCSVVDNQRRAAMIRGSPGRCRSAAVAVREADC